VRFMGVTDQYALYSVRSTDTPNTQARPQRARDLDQLRRPIAVLIYGYEYEGWPLAPVMDAFECLARREVALSERLAAGFEGLVHPVHQRGEVFAWEVTARSWS